MFKAGWCFFTASNFVRRLRFVNSEWCLSDDPEVPAEIGRVAITWAGAGQERAWAKGLGKDGVGTGPGQGRAWALRGSGLVGIEVRWIGWD